MLENNDQGVSGVAIAQCDWATRPVTYTSGKKQTTKFLPSPDWGNARPQWELQTDQDFSQAKEDWLSTAPRRFYQVVPEFTSDARIDNLHRTIMGVVSDQKKIDDARKDLPKVSRNLTQTARVRHVERNRGIYSVTQDQERSTALWERQRLASEANTQYKAARLHNAWIKPHTRSILERYSTSYEDLLRGLTRLQEQLILKKGYFTHSDTISDMQQVLQDLRPLVYQLQDMQSVARDHLGKATKKQARGFRKGPMLELLKLQSKKLRTDVAIGVNDSIKTKDLKKKSVAYHEAIYNHYLPFGKPERVLEILDAQQVDGVVSAKPLGRLEKLGLLQLKIDVMSHIMTEYSQEPEDAMAAFACAEIMVKTARKMMKIQKAVQRELSSGASMDNWGKKIVRTTRRFLPGRV